MDPYLQRHWGDIHQRFITYSCDAIQAQLPGGLRARMQERVFVESPDAMRPSVFFPDIRVFERPALARYRIDYSRDPIPPLLPEDAIWADGLLRSQRLRS